MTQSLAAHWVRRLFPRRTLRPQRTFRPTLERLEDRLTPALVIPNQATFAVGAGPNNVAVADFNRDGRPDLVTANASAGTISILLNTTAPGATVPAFASQVTIAAPGATLAAVGDFNNDGRPDIAVLTQFPRSVLLYLNTTADGDAVPSFQGPQSVAVGFAPTALAAADFNGDGLTDIVVVGSQGGGPQGGGTAGVGAVLMNGTPAGATAPVFTASATFAAGISGFPLALTTADFNGDGRPDLAVVGDGVSSQQQQAAGTAAVLLDLTTAGAKAPVFAAPATFAVGVDATGIAAADFNGDNRPDLAVATATGGTVEVLANTTTPGNGAPTFAAQSLSVSDDPRFVAAMDFDGDGKSDIVTANEDNTLSVLLNTTAPPVYQNGGVSYGAAASAPSFAAAQTFGQSSRAINFAVADFNGDGRPDLAVSGDQFVQGSDTFVGVASVLTNETLPYAAAAPALVADFAGHGIQAFNRASQTWTPLVTPDASLLAVNSSGLVVADFPGYGVQIDTPAGGWSALESYTKPDGTTGFGPDAAALAVSAAGAIAADFPGYGVFEYRAVGGWRALTPVDAALLAMDATGAVYGEFMGYGVFKYTPATGAWAMLLPSSVYGAATALSVDARGDLLVSLPNFTQQGLTGVVKAFLLTDNYADNGAVLATTNSLAALAFGSGGDYADSYPAPYGTYEHAAVLYYPPAPPSRVTQFMPTAALLALDDNGSAYADFGGSGVWEFDPFRGWYQLPQPGATTNVPGQSLIPYGDASLLAVG